ncbi:MarR family winged helix-turn-helix transcriptional regulator [Amycolatopsis cihanbeyliensis]|uniref:DNA-binding MarR family transcriptional regulator n=1 Tax=Amycolatopsis cihanbeyliensis TaxID=1128664 RepID=A0A542DHV3_AMYCI|nr:MarR family transcriptional regulator [Amycolatopsis cihanbeyliensis]TQJ02677.1 DNA-binding MarR family transcriptional regulator [Amycolatopsis cihanbeyliensis]
MDAGDEEERLGALLLRLAKSAHVLQRRNMGDLGLTPAQARALAVLGHCDAPPRMAELAERLQVVPRAVTPVVDALEEAGLVRREIDPDNRRSTLVTLTEEGRVMCRRFGEFRTRAAGELFGALDTGERRTLLQLMEKVEESGKDLRADCRSGHARFET